MDRQCGADDQHDAVVLKNGAAAFSIVMMTEYRLLNQFYKKDHRVRLIEQDQVLPILRPQTHDGSQVMVYDDRCPLICFYAVEIHLPHRVAHQFGLQRSWPPKEVSTSIELHKANFRQYFRWYHIATRYKLRQKWTGDDYANIASSKDEDTRYDVRAREGTVVQIAPILDRVSVHDIDNTLRYSISNPGNERRMREMLEPFLQKLQRCLRRAVARCGCCCVAPTNVVVPSLSHRSRASAASTAAASSSIEAYISRLWPAPHIQPLLATTKTTRRRTTRMMMPTRRRTTTRLELRSYKMLLALLSLRLVVTPPPLSHARH
ncbi:uncharacterized protein C2845_PM06G03970 [Panicum miliaceum]|uniref:Uncharacterized protein n=1 Tax=Panicum miliaceum TaxID=4540 RepID=A0A3L6RCP2_PANMI|nr:uncharacterized protein C2845_PM06G03970 [Panicum miliaceum]